MAWGGPTTIREGHTTFRSRPKRSRAEARGRQQQDRPLSLKATVSSRASLEEPGAAPMSPVSRYPSGSGIVARTDGWFTDSPSLGAASPPSPGSAIAKCPYSVTDGGRASRTATPERHAPTGGIAHAPSP